jgi:glutamyl-tRNA reductase
LAAAAAQSFKRVFVVSTCNRTEVFGYAQHPLELAALMLQHTSGAMDVFLKQDIFCKVPKRCSICSG